MEIDTVLIKVASRCNINCSYCYVYHMGDTNWSRIDKLISLKTMRDMVFALKLLAENQKRKFSIVLHGGEPLMLGLSGLGQFLELIRTAVPNSYPIGIQTNGTLITNEILDVCSKFKASISISIDGPACVNDRARLDHKNRSTFVRVMNGISQLSTHRDAIFLYSGVLAVIDPDTDPEEIYSFFKKLNPPSIDFLYKDGNHSRLPPGKTSINSIEYGSWMARILDLYVADRFPIPIRVLDDMLKLLIGGKAVKEGVGLSDFGIVIFDTDGAITKTDTLKSAYAGADRFSTNWKVEGTELHELLSSDEYRQYHNLQKPTSPTCLQCPELRFCGGGMTVHRWKDGNDYDNPSVYCADQLVLIAKMRSHLQQLGLVAQCKQPQ